MTKSKKKLQAAGKINWTLEPLWVENWDMETGTLSRIHSYDHRDRNGNDLDLHINVRSQSQPKIIAPLTYQKFHIGKLSEETMQT